jgi:hypothetical protein
VVVKSGPQMWRPKVDHKSCGQKRTPKVVAKSGPQKGRSKKDPKSDPMDVFDPIEFF